MTIDMQAMQQRLGTELQAVIASIAHAAQAGGTAGSDPAGAGHLSRIDAIQMQAAALGTKEQLLTRRRKLEAALDRVTAGSFGQCCECGSPLDADRLDADAATVFCGECASGRQPG